MGKKLNGDDEWVGKRVLWRDWDDSGEYVTMSGVVEDAFREPPEEDRLERLNYRVRKNNGDCSTPYAHECELAS